MTIFLFWVGWAQIAYELPAGTNWNFDVHWYQKIPGVISASSFDGKVGIYNIKVQIYFGGFIFFVLDETGFCFEKYVEVWYNFFVFDSNS